MNYLLDKKAQRKKIYYGISFVLVCLFLFYFRSGVWNGFSYMSQIIFRPVWVLGVGIGDKFENLGSYFASKNSLFLDNKTLKSKLETSEAEMLNYRSLLQENISLKDILGRRAQDEILAERILAVILAKPGQNIYDTLIIDIGIDHNLKTGDVVFALGNVPIGRITEVYPNSSKVVLFSKSGERTQAIISASDIFIDVVGRGGGNFEMTVSRDLVVVKGDEVVWPGITPYVLGVVEAIVSDPRDPFVRALLTSPVNVQELKFVEVKRY